jgi:hypothetical protein
MVAGMNNLASPFLLSVALLAALSGCRGCEPASNNVTPSTDGGAPWAEYRRGGATDLLFVIDNSGSMAEEQRALALNASSSCPELGCGHKCGTTSAVNALKQFMFDGAGKDLAPGEWPALGATGSAMKEVWDDCGMFERLYLFENDFRIGIITTDLGTTDGERTICRPEEYPDQRQPTLQRGCLQPIPGSTSSVLTPQDGDLETVFSLFKAGIGQVGTCGFGAEQGLGAVEQFLTPGSHRAAPSCDQDLGRFLRNSAASNVVLVILSDEEDCSHPPGVLESVMDVLRCYTEPNLLSPTSEFTRFIRGLKADPSQVNMVAIVGGFSDATGQFVAGDCRYNGDVQGGAPITPCKKVMGNSIMPSQCGVLEDNAYCTRLPPASFRPQGSATPVTCCTADQGARYVEVASSMEPGHFAFGSVCEQNFKQPLTAAANLANR